MNSSEEKTLVSSIHISAAKALIWDVLLKLEYTKPYMFGCETQSNWQVGSDLLWNGEYQGQLMTFVKGKIICIDAPNLLTYTVFDPNNKQMADIPENYLHVTYSLESSNNGTLLTAKQGDYSTVAEGEKRYAESYNNGEGWMPILRQIKTIAEQIPTKHG
jgi:hypothetical protein